jgi:hypothetical protein
VHIEDGRRRMKKKIYRKERKTSDLKGGCLGQPIVTSRVVAGRKGKVGGNGNLSFLDIFIHAPPG